ncbi:aminopeptidase P N-terminal domain-containing protein [Candidatus Venteria ishoeyi]|uniref:Xaa-Pro aminopeptidase n=1 Tax=Candidatus Venteria ishoeyi TaxID=1899563 RepID=A0A1H6FB74_9GAMM|nr:aminopeptidase P N-terminal domain-containing protein [Candidatus Venteria ishoeyi]MDM8547294.1 aminopeptidase P N-terminal domain-containing protein [Candidatus Venteria ishoeyi]SEH07360.1 Xaa-Pro aminopeptidase [Candidatus Venteria ishoeyi]
MINQKEFTQRRKALMELIGPGGIALIPTAPVKSRNRDVDYPYRPDSYFYYLTGFAEQEALAVLIPGREQGQYLLFCREKDPEQETWHGRRVGLENACDIYGADDAFPIDDVDDIVPGLLENCSRLYYAMGYDAAFDEQVHGWLNGLRARVREGVCAPTETIHLDHLINELRLFKSPAEIATLRISANIAIAAHRRAMECCRPGMNEYQIAAQISHTFMERNAQMAYPSIVGGGENSCILHYMENNTPLADGDVLLIDAGAEYQFYASDITRTIPVNGRFTPAQKAVYEVVLNAQEAAIAEVYPGNPWIMPHLAAIESITEGLLNLGLLQGELDSLIENEAYKRFFMHRSGHWLGMDVHDVGEYKVNQEWRGFESGMVLTVEPGIYIPAGDEDIAPKWWNIGIRIEDDVLVTDTGHEVLTAALEKTVAEIENRMSQHL